MTIHAKLHSISLEHLTKLKSLSSDDLQQALGYLTPILADKLFQVSGIESDELDSATERLGIEQDPKYQLMVKDYKEKVAALKLGQ